MAQHNELGAQGEKEAISYLKNKGYTIRHANWTAGSLEIDIVAQIDNWLVMVEVKTRKSDYFEPPTNAITSRKIKNLVAAADVYIRKFGWEGETRFDIITLIQRGQNFEVEHIEDAFLPSL